jgi:hypothetical protein
MMLEELQRRNYSQATVRAYLHAVEAFAEYFHTQPDRLGLEHIRTWQAHLFHDKKTIREHRDADDCRRAILFCQDAAAAISSGRGSLPEETPSSSHGPDTG